MSGLLKPSCAVILFFNVACHCFGCASVPDLFHKPFCDQTSTFTFAPVLLVNHSPPPNVAPTSCTSITGDSHVTENGFVLWSMFTLSQLNLCCGGLLSLCFANAISSFSPSR